MEITTETTINTPSFTDGRLISSRLSANAVGSLLQVNEFLSRFQQVLGVQDHLVFEELEKELVCPWPDNLGYLEEHSHYSINTVDTCELGDSSTMNSVTCIRPNLTTIHRALLPELVCRLLNKIAKVMNISGGALDKPPINHLTWPEVVRKYIFAYVLAGGAVDSSNIVFHNGSMLIYWLQGDGGICCGSLTGVAGADLDARLHGIAVDKIFGKVKREGNTLSMSIMGTMDIDSGVPKWAKALDPVKKLPTNVGSRIRRCVYEALEKNPPEWAKKLLEASIAKGLYKANASGPTKRAVSDILSKVITGASRPLPDSVESQKYGLICDSLMKKCLMVLRKVAADDIGRVFSDLVGRNLNSDINGVRAVFGSASTRPLDLRTIDLRLLHGTYGGSHDAFREDVRELWINLPKTHKNGDGLLRLANTLSLKFESLFKSEVDSFLNRVCECIMGTNFTAEVEKELEELLTSEIPEAPWETGICKVCGINKDDKKVLLCDKEGCNAEYHTYCLTPPLSEIPEGNWYCPTCVPPNQRDDTQDPRQILQFVKENREEAGQLLDIAIALEETEHWDLDADKKTFLLQFLCEESLNNESIHGNLDPSKSKELLKSSLRNEFLGIDSAGRLYWGFPKTSTHRGIVVNEPANHSEFAESGRWILFQSAEEISNLADSLRENDRDNRKLRDSILLWEKSLLQEGEQNGTDSLSLASSAKSFSSDGLATKATTLLEMKYKNKPRRKNEAKRDRCVCLEPIIPSRYHCDKCHETFFTNVEYERHKNFTCGLSSSVEKSKVDVGKSRDTHTINFRNDVIDFFVPEASLKPIVGKARHILRQLKINLLDMEADLSDEARRASRASPKWRSAWCEHVKSANTIYEMIEAVMVFGTMIKTEYVNNTWWWYWSSFSSAAKTCTMSALALRIYTLDAAINYQLLPTTTSDKTPNIRKRSSPEPNEERKKPKEPEVKQEIKKQLKIGKGVGHKKNIETSMGSC